MKLFRSVPPECPKCGRTTIAAKGENSWAMGPTYNADDDVLFYSCRDCRYGFTTPTRDAQTKSDEMSELLTKGGDDAVDNDTD